MASEEYKEGINPDYLSQAIHSGNVSTRKLPKPVYFYNAKKLVEGVYKGYGKSLMKIKYNDPDKILLKSLRENIYIFSAAKTFQQTLEMTRAMRNSEGVVPYNEFKEAVERISTEFNENYLATEYNTAIAQSQSASAWNRFEKEKATLNLLRYSTIGDACDICAPLDGTTLPVDDPFWDEYMPPNHFNCECLVEQEAEGEVEQTDSEQADRLDKEVGEKMDDMFKMNPGKTGEVFDKDHPYFSVPKEYKEFARENFGLHIPEIDD